MITGIHQWRILKIQENILIICLLAQTTKQLLSNFQPWKFGKYKATFKATWLMPQPWSCLNFLRFQSWKFLKSCVFLSKDEEVALYPKSNIYNFRPTNCYFQYVLLKITLLPHVRLKMFDYGESRTSRALLVSI